MIYMYQNLFLGMMNGDIVRQCVNVVPNSGLLINRLINKPQQTFLCAPDLGLAGRITEYSSYEIAKIMVLGDLQDINCHRWLQGASVTCNAGGE